MKRSKIVLCLFGLYLFLNISMTANAEDVDLVLNSIGATSYIKNKDILPEYFKNYISEEKEIEQCSENIVKETKYSLNEDEKEMLQKIAIAEAKSEGSEGMAYVMLTVLNRVNNDKFPDSIKDVIFENKNDTWQFSTVKSGEYEKSIPNDESKEALLLIESLDNKGMLYFESSKNEDNWHSRNLTFIFKYKNHRFYK